MCSFYVLSVRDWDDFANLIVIRHIFLFFILVERKWQEGNLLVTHDNEYE